MELKEILSAVDHTLLTQTATWDEIRGICDDAVKYATASVCIPASYVERAKKYLGDKMAVCTVIGFPNGYSTTAAKVFEAKDAIENGADEIDMVANIGWIKDGLYDRQLEEIKKSRKSAEIVFLKSSLKPACFPARKKFACAKLSPNRGLISSKLPQAFPPAEPPLRMSLYLQSILVRMSALKRRAELKPWKMRNASCLLAHPVLAQAALSS
jgi:deoxyribose-phosphate aldolase